MFLPIAHDLLVAPQARRDARVHENDHGVGVTQPRLDDELPFLAWLDAVVRDEARDAVALTQRCLDQTDLAPVRGKVAAEQAQV